MGSGMSDAQRIAEALAQQLVGQLTTASEQLREPSHNGKHRIHFQVTVSSPSELGMTSEEVAKGFSALSTQLSSRK